MSILGSPYMKESLAASLRERFGIRIQELLAEHLLEQDTHDRWIEIQQQDTMTSDELVRECALEFAGFIIARLEGH